MTQWHLQWHLFLIDGPLGNIASVQHQQAAIGELEGGSLREHIAAPPQGLPSLLLLLLLPLPRLSLSLSASGAGHTASPATTPSACSPSEGPFALSPQWRASQGLPPRQGPSRGHPFPATCCPTPSWVFGPPSGRAQKKALRLEASGQGKAGRRRRRLGRGSLGRGEGESEGGRGGGGGGEEERGRGGGCAEEGAADGERGRRGSLEGCRGSVEAPDRGTADAGSATSATFMATRARRSSSRINPRAP